VSGAAWWGSFCRRFGGMAAALLLLAAVTGPVIWGGGGCAPAPPAGGAPEVGGAAGPDGDEIESEDGPPESDRNEASQDGVQGGSPVEGAGSDGGIDPLQVIRSSLLTVHSTPEGVPVFIDGHRAGLTPYHGMVEIGRRRLRLEWEGRVAEDAVWVKRAPDGGRLETWVAFNFHSGWAVYGFPFSHMPPAPYPRPVRMAHSPFGRAPEGRLFSPTVLPAWEGGHTAVIEVTAVCDESGEARKGRIRLDPLSFDYVTLSPEEPELAPEVTAGALGPPLVSPDGVRVAVPTEEGVCIRSLAGEDQLFIPRGLLSETTDSGLGPWRWSPNGDRLLIVVCGEWVDDFFLVDLSSGDVIPVVWDVVHPKHFIWPAEWLSDGRLLVEVGYYAERDGTYDGAGREWPLYMDLATTEPDGGDLRAVMQTSEGEGCRVVEVQGGWLLYHRWRLGEGGDLSRDDWGGVGAVGLDGTGGGHRDLYQGTGVAGSALAGPRPDVYVAQWSEDGLEYRLLRCDPEAGGPPELIAALPSGEHRWGWAFDLTLSPDGSVIWLNDGEQSWILVRGKIREAVDRDGG